MRTREVWIHAVDLDNGGRFGDFPKVVLESLLDDIVGMWRKKDLGAGIALEVDGGIPVVVKEDARSPTRCRARSLPWCAGPPAAARSESTGEN